MVVRSESTGSSPLHRIKALDSEVCAIMETASSRLFLGPFCQRNYTSQVRNTLPSARPVSAYPWTDFLLRRHCSKYTYRTSSTIYPITTTPVAAQTGLLDRSYSNEYCEILAGLTVWRCQGMRAGSRESLTNGNRESVVASCRLTRLFVMLFGSGGQVTFKK